MLVEVTVVIRIPSNVVELHVLIRIMYVAMTVCVLAYVVLQLMGKDNSVVQIFLQVTYVQMGVVVRVHQERLLVEVPVVAGIHPIVVVPVLTLCV